MPRFTPVASPKCPRCLKSVYAAEQVIGPNGAPWHKSCFTCANCNRKLDSANLSEHEGQAFCRPCYQKAWGPKGYGYASGGSFLGREEAEDGRDRSTSIDQTQQSQGQDQDQEEINDRLVPVNAQLPRRNSLEMIRQQAEEARRAYDEAQAQRTPGGSVRGRPTLEVEPGSQERDQYTQGLSRVSSTSSSLVAERPSPVPSTFSSASSASSAYTSKSAQPLYLSQHQRLVQQQDREKEREEKEKAASQSRQQETDADYLLARSTLAFQTGAGIASEVKQQQQKDDEEHEEPPKPTATKPASSNVSTSSALDESYLEFMPVKLVARKDDNVVASKPNPVAQDEWESDLADPKPSTPTYHSPSFMKQQRQYSGTQGKVSSQHSPSASASQQQQQQQQVERLVEKTMGLHLQEHKYEPQQPQSTRQQAKQEAVEEDEWDAEPTPSVPKPKAIVNAMPARHVPASATHTWTSQPTPATHSSTEEPVASSAANPSPIRSQVSTTTSYYQPPGTKRLFGNTNPALLYQDKCPRCSKTVYAAESVLAPGSIKYHKMCFTCSSCNRRLDSTNVTDHQGNEILCKQCHGKAHGPKGFGYGQGSSFLHTELGA